MTEEEYNIICAYFNDELSDEQEALLMQQLAEYPELMAQFELELMLQRGLDKEALIEALAAVTAPGFETADAHIEMLRQTMQADKDEKIFTPVISFFERYKVVLTAAAVLILIVLGNLIINPQHKNIIATLFQKDKPVIDSIKKENDTIKLFVTPKEKEPMIAFLSPKELYAKYHTFYDGSDKPPDELVAIASWIKNKKYEQVVAKNENEYIYRDDLKDELTPAFFCFYKGVSLLELNKLDSATIYFAKTIKDKNIPAVLKYKTQWYYALALLKKEDTVAAEKLFTEIAGDQNSPYHTKALSVLKEMP